MSALTFLCFTPLLLVPLVVAVPPPASQSSIDIAAACDALADDIDKKIDGHFAGIFQQIQADDCSYITDMTKNCMSACMNTAKYMALDDLGNSSTGAELDESVSLYFLSTPGSSLAGIAAKGTGKGN